MRPTAPDISQILLEEGLLSPEDLQRARQEQIRARKKLGRVLVDMGLVSESDLVAALAKQFDMRFVDLTDQVPDPAAVALIPPQMARRYVVIAYGFDADGVLLVATSDPANIVAFDDIRTATDREIRPVVAARSDILTAIDRHVRVGKSIQDVADFHHGRDDDLRVVTVTDEEGDAPLVKFVNAIISQAVQDRASDIHVEPQEHALRVRYRVDGVLHEITSQNRKIAGGVVSRLKIMADMDIAERRIPQDGRISLTIGTTAVDLRVSTLPTVLGEKIVIRILDKSSVLLTLSDLGFSEHNFARYEHSYRKPYGMILVTGPTGSGKSTTLYATLNDINSPDINIVTVEDPVEYRLPGISQVQINPRAGLTFPTALRSILRQDPDVVLVGEMRDHETAQIGMEAALTGHLVLATLHTNDAPSSVTRLTEMGIDPFLVASSVDCIVAQRLARRLCRKCRQPHEPSPAELQAAGFAPEAHEGLPTLYRASGCGNCANTGYRGRLSVHEVMPVTEEIERLIVERASSDEIAKFAAAQGMRALRDDGLAKVLQGQTTIEEIARVIV